MRFYMALAVSLLASGCGGSSGGQQFFTGGADAGGAGAGGDAAVGGDAAPSPPLTGPAPTPRTLADDAVGIVGVTADGQVIYRNADSLVAMRLDGSERTPRVISDQSGTVQIRGSIVFQFVDIDWTTNLGKLTIWSADGEAHEVGTALFGEDTTVASADGGRVAYVTHVTGTSADLVVATPDLGKTTTVVPQVGLGSQATCRPSFGFVGDSLIAAWCKPGEMKASLDRFDAPGFEPRRVATDVGTVWSADTAGKHFVYVDSAAHALFNDGKSSVPVDDNVGWAMILPDASATLYTVGDQLRRSALPDAAATPIVTSKFVSRVALSPDNGYALYSTVFNYDRGTHQDLRITPTDVFTLHPVVLVADATAEVPASPFTRDGRWVLYLAGDGKKTLHLVSVDGSGAASIDDVGTMIAAHGSRVVYSHALSDPAKYPVTAELAVVDAASPAQPLELAAATTDGRQFELTADGRQLVYMKPNETGGAASLMVQEIP